MQPYEQLGLFYLGKRYDLWARRRLPDPILYDSRDLLTRAVCVGMTGSGKTGLGVGLIEDAALDGIPMLAIDPKGDLPNLLLTFPSLAPVEFEPWVNAADATAAGLAPEAFAARQAETWRSGLLEWDQPSERVARLRAAADVRVYTPGSRSATPLALLRTLVPPPGGDAEDLSARIAAASQSVLSLAGLAEISPHPREQVLVSTLLHGAAAAEHAVDLPWLVQHVQKPALDRVGVLDLENLLSRPRPAGPRVAIERGCSHPGFRRMARRRTARYRPSPLHAGWTPQDRDRLHRPSRRCTTDAGGIAAVERGARVDPRAVRHQLVARADLHGRGRRLLPPPANPPSKPPLLTLMKQAGAFGVGVMLSTQNPVDVDYRGLSNAGTWFLGKLQTERDKARTLLALGKRIFLLHNVHDAAPVVFETRWTLSYLRGPMTKDELRRATLADRSPQGTRAPQIAAAASPAARPVVPAGVREFFVPAVSATYDPSLYRAARVSYVDTRRGLDTHLDIHVMAPFGTGAVAVNWNESEDTDVAPEALAPARAGAGAQFTAVPAAALDARNYPVWERDFSRWLAQARPLRLFGVPGLKLSSQPGETEREFLIRVRQAQREQRDARVERLRDKYALRVARLTERLARTEEAVARERQQVGDQKLQTAVSIGATVIGARMGRRAVTMSTLGRATTAARGVGRAATEAEDVVPAEARVAELQAESGALQAEPRAEIEAIAKLADDEPIETVEIKPARRGIDIRLVALVWRPA